MKFSAVIISGFVAVALAQSKTASSKVPVPTETTSYTPEQVKCLDGCGSDLSCQAECFGNPAPTEDMVNATTECVANCDQGDGSPEDTQAYAQCMDKCVSAQFYSSTLGSNGNGGAATAGSGSGSGSTKTSGTVSVATATGASGSSATGSSGSSSSSSSSSDDSDSDSSSSPSGTGSSSSESADASGSAASATASAGAASGLQVAGASTGVFAILAAMFAL